MEWANNRDIIMGLILNSVLGANCVKRTYWHLVQLQLFNRTVFLHDFSVQKLLQLPALVLLSSREFAGQWLSAAIQKVKR